MGRKLLRILVMAAISSALAQTAHTQKSQVEHDRGLPLERADVPMYPTLARTARISGTVEVQVTVKDGKVIKIEVKSGPQILASATTANIRSWRFYDFVSAKFATTFIYHLGEKERLNTGNPKIELELPLRVTITTGPVPVETMHGMGSGT